MREKDPYVGISDVTTIYVDIIWPENQLEVDVLDNFTTQVFLFVRFTFQISQLNQRALS